MKFLQFLVTKLGSPPALYSPTDARDVASLTASQCCITLSVLGETHYYPSVGVCRVAEHKTSQLWYLDLGGNGGSFFSIALGNVGATAYTFGGAIPDAPDLAILTYGCNQRVYSSHCEPTHGSARRGFSQGCLNVDFLDFRRRVVISFCGTLMLLHAESQLGQALSISGRFCLGC